MRLPSTRTIESAFPGHGRELRRLLEDPSAARRHPAAVARRAECYHPPTFLDQLLHALDAEAEAHGVEYIAHRDDGFRNDEMRGLEYLNVGDPYTPTLIYNHSADTWRVCGYGDIIERSPHLYP